MSKSRKGLGITKKDLIEYIEALNTRALAAVVDADAPDEQE